MNYIKSKAKTQAQIIRELEIWAMEKDNMYPNVNRKSYSYALNQFKNFFFRLQKKQENQKSLNYWCVAWRWDFRQVVRFIHKVFIELLNFWALGSNVLKKFIERSKQILHKQKAYVYKSRGKELPSEPEPTQKELEELFAEAMAQNAKNPTVYKNFILNKLVKQDKMTVNNFNEWLKERQESQASQELQNKLNSFDYKRLTGKKLVLSSGDTLINDVVCITQDYVVVALNNGTTMELPKVGILQEFDKLAAKNG